MFFILVFIFGMLLVKFLFILTATLIDLWITIPIDNYRYWYPLYLVSLLLYFQLQNNWLSLLSLWPLKNLSSRQTALAGKQGLRLIQRFWKLWVLGVSCICNYNDLKYRGLFGLELQFFNNKLCHQQSSLLFLQGKSSIKINFKKSSAFSLVYSTF